MSCGVYGEDRFRATVNGLERVGGTRSYKPYKDESESEFKKRVEVYAINTAQTLLNAGLVFVDVVVKFVFVQSRCTQGIVEIVQQPELTDFNLPQKPLDMSVLLPVA